MNSDGNRAQAEEDAAWLTAKLLTDLNLSIAQVKQHYDWSGKNCPSVLRGRAGGWDGFLARVTYYLGTCSYSVNPSSASPAASSGSGSFNVTASSGCSWLANSDAPDWLHTSSTGSGNGIVSYTYDVNLGTSSRAGHITVGGQPFTLTQAGSMQPAMSLAYNGTAIPNADQSPSVAKGTDFGSVNYGSQSSPRTFTISNTGNGALNLTGSPKVQFGGNNPSDFYMTAAPSSPVAASGGSTTFQLVFEPTVNTGLRSATITIANNDPAKNPYTFTVQGTAQIQPRVDPSLEYNGVASLNGDQSPTVAKGTDFGSVIVGSQSATHSFQFYNYGNINLTLTGTMVQLSGANSGDFTIVSMPSSPVAPNQYSTIGIRFQPTASGLRAASMLIYFDATYGLGATSPYTVALQGTATPSDTTPPALTITAPINGAVVTNASLAVTGTASDSGYGNNGISSVTVNGASAIGGTASGTGTANWTATITLVSGPNTITVVAKDTLNNATQKQINVTYNEPGQSNIVFSDSFNDNVIDPGKWTTSGNTVTEASQTMQVLTTVTDQGGGLTSVPVPINPHGDITITRRAFQHYGNQYFAARMSVKFGDLDWAAVRYANYIWAGNPYYGWEDRYGIYLSRSNVDFISISSNTNLAGPFAPIWDTWFTEKLVYSPDTGNLQYFTNNQKVADFFIGVMPPTNTPTMQFQFTAWGWYTGHQQLLDDLLVTQTAVASPQPQLTGMSISNRVVRFMLNGTVGSNYVVQVSTNLLNWSPLSTNTITSGGRVVITDSAAANTPRRFYRAMAR